MGKNWLKDEMEEGSAHARKLISFAAQEFGKVLDERIEKLKLETGDLITAKLVEVRQEMSAAANVQKRSAIRNLALALFSAVLVGLLSVLYRRYLSREFDLYFVFRSFVLAIAVGHGIWLLSKGISNFLNASKFKKDAAFYASQYLGVFRIRGMAGHLVTLAMLIVVLAYVNFGLN
jgi:exosome complex RNA-binding protein Rrp4